MELLDNSAPSRKQQPVNLKKELTKYLRKWPWFLLSIVVFYTAAKIYLRYTEPQYYTKTSLKLQESKAKNSALSDLKNLGMGVSGDNELQGETTVITSKPILGAVVHNLNLSVSFYSIGKIKEVELYKDSPLTAEILSLDNPDTFFGTTTTISPVGNNSYRLSGSSKVFRFGVPADLNFGTVLIDVKPGFQLQETLKVVFQNPDSVVKNLESRISVSLPENKGLFMELSMVGPVPKKSQDILNEVTRQYLIDGIKDKNEEAQNTQNFINERLEIITKDLSGIEGQKESFKRSNQITDLETQAGQAIVESSENTKLITSQSMQLELVNSVLAASSKEQLLPSGIGLPTSVETSIAEYNELLLTRNRVLKQASPENPAILEMNKKLSALQQLIRRNLTETRETLRLQIGQATAQLNVAKGNISKYPTQEKVFRSIDRQQTLKEQLYLYLLQKREENAITLAVTAPKAKIVNPAFTTGVVEPKYSNIIYGSVAAGFMLPLVILVLLQILDTKIHSKQQLLQLLPEASVIAEIPVTDDPDAIVHPNDFSVFAEAFRILSSNLKFLLKASNHQQGGVVLVTSSIKGEGKTTIAMNLALTLANKKRVLLIGADIRNPQLRRFIKEKKNVGLTDYLVSEHEIADQYIFASGLNERLDVLFSGQIAPNPNDLLDMEKFDRLLNDLRAKYDYVVMDSAPVMWVSDTLHLVEKSDVVLYTAKSDFTEKEMIHFADGFKNENKIRNMAFVLNGVKPENTRYGKKYGYGYYSYTHETAPKWWQKFKI